MLLPTKLYLLLCLLLSKSTYSNEDGVTSVSLCSGDQLNLKCHTAPNETLLQWSLTIPGRPTPELRFISSEGSTASVTPFSLGQTVFQFLRTSISPLTSLMVIDNITTSLNGTRVDCSHGGRVVSTDIINVIGNDMIPPIPNIELNIASAQFANETVIVVLEWTVENGSFHDLIIAPQVETVNLGPSSRQVAVSYNTSYSIRGEARLCRQYSSHSINLHYVKCISPLHIMAQNEQLVITDYSSPAIEGTVALFSCSRLGYELTGPRSATCTRNGEWVPDPRQVQCQAIDCGRPSLNMNVSTTYNSTLLDSRLTLTCAEGLIPSGEQTAQCLSNGRWTPNPADFTCKSASEGILNKGNSCIVDRYSIIAAVILSTIVAVVFFTIGCLLGCASGWFGHKRKISTQKNSDKNSNSQPAPLYEDLQPVSMPRDQKKAFELEGNIAYCPVSYKSSLK